MNGPENEVIVEEIGRAGLIRLNRPNALNAITLGMIGTMEAFYHRCMKLPHIYGFVMEGEGRAFSAGGDVRAMYAWGRDAAAEHARYYSAEYQHNWTLHCLKKPHVALIDGVVMGGGVGVCLYGTHRVAGENIRLAMPETAIGFIPDVGASWFLPRLPGHIGLYLGLTGVAVEQADAFFLRFVTHCVPGSSFPSIKAATIEGEPIDEVLRQVHRPPSKPGCLQTMQPAIDRLFGAATLDGIFRNLEAETGAHRDFARTTLDTLTKCSPLGLRMTFEALRRGTAYRNLKEALVTEYRLALAMLRAPDFYEGVRAHLIDKDRDPRWQFERHTEIDNAAVVSFFNTPSGGDLQLVDYWGASTAFLRQD